MARPDFLDDWLDANNVEKPVHVADQIGTMSYNDAKAGPVVGLFIRYTDRSGQNPAELRFHLPAEFARQLSVELAKRAELAQSGKPDRTQKPN
jgi:hypothetical protein